MSEPPTQANPIDWESTQRLPAPPPDNATRAWVGDLVHDEDAAQPGIVTDVLSETIWVLRPEVGSGKWVCMNPERLTVITPRAERVGKPAPLDHDRGIPCEAKSDATPWGRGT
ncbi:hypothetical protein GCM10011608_12940 [Micromonospora sonchi]|uniref:Uncharacterized protein n=1 Tax=Micromonospora sonchi TaxID=1763543 RepID=A0A917TP38_9ACTN|nr:hypothetical protein [Micromonospora sonchi]GGM29642.1 hypothetical protein GCM10011608_12940 [Micromonospora sonchi]